MSDHPETVLATFHVQEGKEAEFEQAHRETWQVCVRLGLVEERAHVVVRGKEQSGKPNYVEVLTWKDRSVTGNPPAELRTLWGRLEAACEARDGHRGIEFPEVRIIDM